MSQAASVPKSLERGLDILSLVAQSPRGLRYSHLVEHLELPNTTVTRLVQALCRLGWLDKDQDRYIAGEAMKEIAAGPALERLLLQIAREPMRQLSARTLNSTALLLWTGQDAVFLDRSLHEGSMVFQPPGYVIQHIQDTPWGVFFMDETQWEKLLSREQSDSDRSRRTQWLKQQRHRLASEGYCCGHVENRYRLASPIRDAEQRAVGALALGGNPLTLDRRAIAAFGPLLADLASACSRRLAMIAPSQKD
jgi:DNA-binding IclR family transcriptional regulator